MTGSLANTAAQDAERAVDRKLSGIEEADLHELLRQPWGRRLYYRLVFLLGRLDAESFDPSIKDGVCAGIHMAHREGIRWMAGILRDEAIKHFPDLWTLMLQERVTAAAEEAKQRAKARETPNPEGDE